MYKEPAEAVDTLILEKLNMEAMKVEFTVNSKEQEKIVETGKLFIDLILRKNNDYGSSAFKVPILTPGISADMAILVRMSDKIERLHNLLKGNSNSTSETIEDTITDLGAYCLLWLSYFESQSGNR